MSTPDARDRGLEAMLGRQRREVVRSDACLDAERLAAWADGGLDDEARVRAEAHAADCARCQALLAVVARSEPDRSAAPTPSLWERIGVRWLIPLTAAAAAIGLWMVVPPPRSEAPADTVAALPAPGPAESTGLLQSAPPAAADRGANLQPLPSTPTSEARGTTGSPATARPDQPASPARVTQPAGLESKVEGIDVEERRQELAKQVETAAEAIADATNERIGREERAAAPAVTVAEPRPAQAPAPPQPPPAIAPAAGRAAALGQLSDAPAAAMVNRSAPVVISSDPTVRWRVAGAGAVERSADGGASWERLDTGVVTRLTAGAAPSARVCWVVGPGGLVLLTTDARTWQLVNRPTNEDLLAVQAIDERSATVRSAGGEQFRTTDAGATWSRVP